MTRSITKKKKFEVRKKFEVQDVQKFNWKFKRPKTQIIKKQLRNQVKAKFGCVMRACFWVNRRSAVATQVGRKRKIFHLRFRASKESGKNAFRQKQSRSLASAVSWGMAGVRRNGPFVPKAGTLQFRTAPAIAATRGIWVGDKDCHVAGPRARRPSYN